MEDGQIADLLRRLRSRQAGPAWDEFLKEYGGFILQVVRLFERDEDRVADCFLFVCEQLSGKGFRRLRQYRPESQAQFSTWLRVVVRNLCVDWYRKECGRHRVFESVAGLGTLDQEIFRHVLGSGHSLEETLLMLQPRFPSLTAKEIAAREESIRKRLTDRQHWLLSLRRRAAVARSEPDAGMPEGWEMNLPDRGPDPEAQVSKGEQFQALRQAIVELPKSDRLLLRLRFEEELTLKKIAHMRSMGSSQRVDRKIRDILEVLRKKMI